MNKLIVITKGLHLFKRAYNATKHQIWVSTLLLLLVTLVFAFFMWIAEGTVNTDFNFLDALVWTFVKYVDDPADVATSPMTILGQIVGTLVGVLGIAIFAVPAGLIGSGLMDAMDEKKHEEELETYRKRIRKAFRRSGNKSLRNYLNTLPDKGGEAFDKLNFVPQYVPISRLQVRQGMDLKDVLEICQIYGELRLKNLAEALSEEEQPEDRFVVEHFPLNRSYGYCVDRGSNVTIICPTGFSEVGISWFSHYMAKLGGFNFISKEIEVDPDELDSFYNMSPLPLFNKKTKGQIDSKDKEALSILKQKEVLRTDFLSDIKKVAKKDSWVIIMTEHLKTAENTFDLHFADNTKQGTQATVTNRSLYRSLLEEFSTVMKKEFDMAISPESARFPLMKNNLAYRLQQEGLECNTFVLRPSSHMMVFDTKKLAYAYRMTCIISDVLDKGKGIEADDVEDMSSTGFGYRV